MRVNPPVVLNRAVFKTQTTLTDMNRRLMIDGTETTLQDFLHANTAPGCAIELEELEAVMQLEVGETTVVGLTFITRMADEK